MGCACAGNDSIHVQNHQRQQVQQQMDNYISYQQQNQAQIHQPVQHQVQNQPQLQNSRIQNNQQPEQNQNIPNYEPYLQSKRDPNFNMKELDTFVGEGIKKMKGYICNIEKEDLERKRNDFWTSRHEGNQDTWDLLHNFCIGEFSNEDLIELIHGSGLQLYAGIINVIFDSKGNLYEIPNYCIHNPSAWDIAKLKITKPKEEKLTLKIRNGIVDYNAEITNTSTGYDLKEGIVNNFKINDKNPGSYYPEKIRLFYRGREIKEKDFLYQHELINNAIIMMTIKPDD